MSRIAELEAERSRIVNTLVDAEPGSIHSKVEEIRKFALAEVADLRGLVSADVQDTLALKTELSNHIAAITLHPTGDWKFVAEGQWFLTGGHIARRECAGGQS